MCFDFWKLITYFFGQTKNDTYTVSKLPALPDQIRADIAGSYNFFNDL